MAIASVTLDQTVVGAIDDPGCSLLLGVTHDDTDADAAGLAAKVGKLRIMREALSAKGRGRTHL